MRYLCIIYSTLDNSTLAEYECVAADWYSARHIARARYENENPGASKNPAWKVDSLNLDAL